MYLELISSLFDNFWWWQLVSRMAFDAGRLYSSVKWVLFSSLPSGTSASFNFSIFERQEAVNNGKLFSCRRTCDANSLKKYFCCLEKMLYHQIKISWLDLSIIGNKYPPNHIYYTWWGSWSSFSIMPCLLNLNVDAIGKHRCDIMMQ